MHDFIRPPKRVEVTDAELQALHVDCEQLMLQTKAQKAVVIAAQAELTSLRTRANLKAARILRIIDARKKAGIPLPEGWSVK